MTPRRTSKINQFGQGTRPQLFAHGCGCGQGMWSEVSPAFADRFHAILFDNMGAGGSDLSAYDPRRYADLRG